MLRAALAVMKLPSSTRQWLPATVPIGARIRKWRIWCAFPLRIAVCVIAVCSFAQSSILNMFVSIFYKRAKTLICSTLTLTAPGNGCPRIAATRSTIKWKRGCYRLPEFPLDGFNQERTRRRLFRDKYRLQYRTAVSRKGFGTRALENSRLCRIDPRLSRFLLSPGGRGYGFSHHEKRTHR